jgi:hypothetical protein
MENKVEDGSSDSPSATSQTAIIYPSATKQVLIIIGLLLSIFLVS